MKFTTIITAVALFCAGALALDKPLNIEKTHSEECADSERTKIGDKISMHYRGTLEKDGSEFDASYNRNQPLDFAVGKGQVIKGWDEGTQGMCIGDKRTLTIQPEYGYGDRGVGPIPGGAVLIFEIELMGINGKTKAEAQKEL
ncbi:FK506-binding protein 2 [Fulvia fulva]|uniref:peptidylprolyl isomerase n=1 Tax=Passalora fulva TaxID=5499 RepID=A0A9Q8L7U1_PASFU|nr:FK506-binding protein 2 [Fulvia fulva]KAK4635577.1 FK506-binding protein 2 [Fulvia fulva]UJO12453.1 FK506-binding protein 2 [Fulvia fulva]WPV10421.1 FK506-binding protein 2 [Fulvia fulva]WPV23996.1 FK506-binding protein 2 [Fulvia fulva]